MPKCTINEKNEITMFWGDSNPSTPSDALDCDVLKTINATGPPDNQTYLYKLVDGKVTPTDAGKDYDAQAYARNRAAEYPSTGDQLDYIFHNGIAKWKTDIVQPVKDKYPKPE